MERTLDDNWTRMLRPVLNKSWRQHPPKQQLYGFILLILKTIHVRRPRHAGHCWKSEDELISDVFLWTSSHGRARVERPAGTYLQHCTGCSLEDLLRAMDDRDMWRERVRGNPCLRHAMMMMLTTKITNIQRRYAQIINQPRMAKGHSLLGVTDILSGNRPGNQSSNSCTKVDRVSVPTIALGKGMNPSLFHFSTLGK